MRRRLLLLWMFVGGAAWAQPAAPGAPAAAEVTVEKADEVAETPPADAEEAYERKVGGLERRVDALKEKVFRSKTRLAILKESVLSSTIAGAEARIVHRNEMGSSFRLEKITYSLDGTPIRTVVDESGSLDDQKEIEILNGPIVPGNHTLSVVMVYRGNGYGIFTYLRGYVFNLRSSHTFHAEEGKLVQIKAVGYEKGGLTTDLKDRPDIRFETEFLDAARGARAAVEKR